MSKDKVKKKQVVQKHNWNLWLLPLQFILMVLPLYLDLHIGFSGYGAYVWNSENDFYLDVFLHGKTVLFQIAAAVMLGLAVYKIVKTGKKSGNFALRSFLPLFIYAGFVVLSTICSVDISYSISGSKDIWEPVGVLLGYVVAALYAYLVVEKAEDVKQLIAAAVIGGGGMAVVGILQAIGKDPLLMEGLQNIFVGAEYVSKGGVLELTFPVGMAYGTLYNPNYVGTYVAMYLPLAIIGVIIFKELWKKLASGAVVLGLLVTLFASQSRTGLISVVAVGVVAMIFLGHAIWKRWYIVVSGVVLAGVAFWAVDMQRDFVLTNRILEMLTLQPGTETVMGVDTTGNGVRVVCRNTEYTVMMPVSGANFEYIALEGNEQKEILYSENKTYGYFTLNDGTTIEIQTAMYDGEYAFGLNINDRRMYFTNQIVADDYKCLNEVGRADECIIPENVFPDYEATASGRGYVWGRTIPLLKNHLLIGSGPDTFTLVFPQNDYVARYKSGFENVIFTRPHNIYLQIAIQTGVISLVAVLLFYMRYFIGSCKRYCFRKFTKMEDWSGFVLFLSPVGFMVAGLANDSLIVVTPMFYTFLGAGVAVNQRLCPAEKRVKENKEKGLE